MRPANPRWKLESKVHETKRRKDDETKAKTKTCARERRQGFLTRMSTRQGPGTLSYSI